MKRCTLCGGSGQEAPLTHHPITKAELERHPSLETCRHHEGARFIGQPDGPNGETWRGDPKVDVVRCYACDALALLATIDKINGKTTPEA
jgi:hypothetical protein